MVPVKAFSFYEAMSVAKKENEEEKAGTSGAPSCGGSGDNAELETTFTVSPSPKDPEPVELNATASASAVNVARTSGNLNLQLVGIEPETDTEKSDKETMTEDVVERCHAHRTEVHGQGDGGMVDSPFLEAFKQKFVNIKLDDSILSGEDSEDMSIEMEGSADDKQEEEEGVLANEAENKEDGTVATSFRDPIIIENNANTEMEVEEAKNEAIGGDEDERRSEKGKGCRCSIL